MRPLAENARALWGRRDPASGSLDWRCSSRCSRRRRRRIRHTLAQRPAAPRLPPARPAPAEMIPRLRPRRPAERLPAPNNGPAAGFRAAPRADRERATAVAVAAPSSPAAGRHAAGRRNQRRRSPACAAPGRSSGTTRRAASRAAAPPSGVRRAFAVRSRPPAVAARRRRRRAPARPRRVPAAGRSFRAGALLPADRRLRQRAAALPDAADEQNSASAEVHNNLGLLYQDRGQLDDAMKEFQQAIASIPST